jgi:hypothetical protein
MRKVIIKGDPPQDWKAEAETVTTLLRAAPEVNRAVLIEEYKHLWRDERIRQWLLDQFSNKCWYTEAYDSVSAPHVDHYRPKGRVTEGDGRQSAGYWWLAFVWTNYRICRQLINVKKRDVFPVVEGARANETDPVSLELEAPFLIDPISDQTRLISYEQDEGGCIAVPAAGIADVDERRALSTIDILGLNRLMRLNRKRADFWNNCLTTIADYKSADGPLALRQVSQRLAKEKLRAMVAYEAEFSSVVEACIRKHAPEALAASVFEGGRANQSQS